MPNPFAISSLVQKRAELSGEIVALKNRLREARAALAHVDATLRLFDPDYPIAAIAPKKPQPPALFERGEPLRTALDTLRTAEAPTTVAHIVAEFVKRKGMPEDAATTQM